MSCHVLNSISYYDDTFQKIDYGRFLDDNFDNNNYYYYSIAAMSCVQAYLKLKSLSACTQTDIVIINIIFIQW